MEFDQHKPIYLQIADAICERILTGQWPEIHNKRGIGYFVSPGAKTVIREKQRSSFISGDLKEVFRKMEILGISIEDISSLYQKYISKDNN